MEIQAPVTAPAEPRRTRLGRQRQIVAALSRHGFGLLVQRSPVPLPGRGRIGGSPESLRAALEELGPTFIKLGQILSTRSDILPDNYVQALSALQDRLPPIATVEIYGMIQHELGAPPNVLYGWFDPDPLATASIGQVHLARLRSGESVAVKVQKPGIAQQVELDLAILHDLARVAVERLDSPLVQTLDEVVEQFSDTLRDELDYVREGRNAERFARLMGTKGRARAPRIYWALTTSRVLTMERIAGVKINDLDALSALGVDRHRLARDLCDLTLRQVFDFGFFHADPHPGNYFVQADGRLGVVDFGMVGALDEATRRDLVLLLAAWVQGDVDGLADALIAMGVARGGAQRSNLQADLRRVLGRYHAAQLGDINVGRVLDDLFRLIRRNQLVLRGDLALMAKTMAMQEGLGLRLDPRFELVAEARPYVEGAVRRLLLPRPDIHSAALNLHAMLDLSATFPQRAQRLLGQLERGDLGVTVRLGGMDPLLRQLHRMVNRVVLALLLAATILTLGRLLDTTEAHGTPLILFFFVVSLLTALALSIWLLVSLFFSDRVR